MVKILAIDVDGTLTDGNIYLGNNGEEFKSFNVQDGYGIAHILPRLGIIPVIITGRESAIVSRRARELGIAELHQGISNKLEKLTEVAQKLGVSMSEVAYIGDDLNDLECIKKVGYSGCPSNAYKSVKNSVTFVCSLEGGKGAVREFIDVLADIAAGQLSISIKGL